MLSNERNYSIKEYIIHLFERSNLTHLHSYSPVKSEGDLFWISIYFMYT